MANWKYSGGYYVDGIGGDDTNAGTSTSPFKTIMAAVAAAEAGGSGYQTIVVGAGIYKERIVASSSSDYLILQADGQVILDGGDLIASSFYNCRFWEINDFIIINIAHSLFGAANDQYVPRFYNCYIKDCANWYQNLAFLEQNYYFFNGCIFDNVISSSPGAAYARYFQFFNCLFINSSFPGFQSNGARVSTNTYDPLVTNCAFYNDNGSTSAHQPSGYYTFNSVYGHNTPVRVNNSTYYSGSGWQDYMDNSVRFQDSLVVSMSFNTTLSGSATLTPSQYTMPQILENKEFFQNHLFRSPQFSDTNNIATAYGYDDSASNPLHTAGGATWTNITSSDISGFQISASTHPTGTIESAVIDQGSPKIVRGIKTSWTTDTPNAVGISVYTSSILNQLPTRQTFEMRYGNQSDLSSNTYKIFDIGSDMYLDSNGTGSGDVDFITGSTIPVTARYLQLKYTLRTDFTGSL